MKICFATNNKNKLKEIRFALSGQHEILSLEDIGCHDELPENQDTLEGNALEKAQYVYSKFNVPCFADDTGLLVHAIDDRPGVYSARYAGPACNSEDNMQKLLGELDGIKDRSARFETVICLITHQVTKQFKGICKGSITNKKSGNEGFGYDPIFKPEAHDITFSEMKMEDKNEISHRGKAIKELLAFLTKA